MDTFFNILHFSPGDNLTFSLIDTVSSVFLIGGCVCAHAWKRNKNVKPMCIGRKMTICNLIEFDWEKITRELYKP